MIVAKIFSVLGNPQSLVPLAIKDSANIAGMTGASAVTSKEEARDRLIDEVGTGAVWLGAIPLYKKVVDKTAFKLAGYDAKYDVRNLMNNEIFEQTKKYAPTEEIKSEIEKIGENKKVFKGLNAAKFVIATGAALATYNIITDMKQKYTHNRIKSKLLKQEEEKKIALMAQSTAHAKKSDAVFTNVAKVRNHDTNQKSGNVNFKGGFDVMLDPVKNMMVFDAGITGERLGKSRSPQELMGYAIKEGGFWAFMYFLGKKIQDHFEDIADTKHNKNIGLDARVLENEKFKEAFADKSIEASLNGFNPEMSDKELYEFLHKNPDNMVVDVAKQSDIIQTYKKPKKWYQIFKKPEDTGKIDTRKFINLDDVRNTHKNMSKLYKQFNESGQNIDEFFGDVRKLKRGSILKNMGSTIFSLGIVLPGIMLADRLLKPGNKEFAVEKHVKEQIAKEKAEKQQAA